MAPLPVSKLSRALEEEAVEPETEFDDITERDEELTALIMQRSEPFTVGTEPGNLRKNAFLNVVPFDSHLVTLPSGSYVNASPVPDYSGERIGYIAAQGPRSTRDDRMTAKEFWEMVRAHRVRCVVMLCGKDELQGGAYWGSGGATERYGGFAVEQQGEEIAHGGGVVGCRVRITDTKAFARSALGMSQGMATASATSLVSVATSHSTDSRGTSWTAASSSSSRASSSSSSSASASASSSSSSSPSRDNGGEGDDDDDRSRSPRSSSDGQRSVGDRGDDGGDDRGFDCGSSAHGSPPWNAGADSRRSSFSFAGGPAGGGWQSRRSSFNYGPGGGGGGGGGGWNSRRSSLSYAPSAGGGGGGIRSRRGSFVHHGGSGGSAEWNEHNQARRGSFAESYAYSDQGSEADARSPLMVVRRVGSGGGGSGGSGGSLYEEAGGAGGGSGGYEEEYDDPASWTVHHLRYEEWRDYDVTTVDGVRRLISVLDSIVGDSRRGGPVVVHCRAGVGRTGSFIAIHNLICHVREQLRDGVHPDEIFIDPEAEVRRLRSRRMLMVQTEDQFRFVYEALDALIKDTLAEHTSRSRDREDHDPEDRYKEHTAHRGRWRDDDTRSSRSSRSEE